MKDDRRQREASEADLVDAARLGDRAAFDRLMDLHAPTLWRVVWRVLRQPADAEDVVRETFLAAWRTLPAYSGELRYGTWLLRTAVTRAIKVVERAEDVGRGSGPLAAGPPVDVPALESGELVRRVNACRARISGPQRAVITLREAEELDWDEVERILSLPPGAARTRLARARFTLWRCVTGAPDTRRLDKTLEEQLSTLLDGDLGALDRAAIDKRIEGNPQLPAVLADLRRLRDVVVKDDGPSIPPNLLERIREELPEGEGPAPRRRAAPPVPSAAHRGAPAAEPAFPFAKVIATLGALGVLAGLAFFILETRVGEHLSQALRARFASAPAAAPDTGTDVTTDAAPESTMPESTADATPGGPPPGAAPLEPAPGAAPQVQPPDGDVPLPGGPSPTATAPPAESAAPDAGATAEVPPQGPVAEPVPDATPAGTVASTPPPPPSGACVSVWTAPTGTLRWTGAPPENAARRLGLLALQHGGKGILLDAPARVRISVPRDGLAALVADLRRQGVAVTDPGAPPAGYDCAAVIVESPAP